MTADIQLILAGSVISLLAGYVLFRLWPRSGKLGINTKTVCCPRCGRKAPMLRIPANLRQALWGGWTCRQCRCEFDKYGREIEP
jgi:hypothetical protein